MKDMIVQLIPESRFWKKSGHPEVREDHLVERLLIRLLVNKTFYHMPSEVDEKAIGRGEQDEIGL